MEVHVYAMCWNEADMLGFFFRHYDAVATRYVIFDDGSSDASPDILHAHPRVEMRRFRRSIEGSLVLSARELYNSAWKESRGAADWVIIADVDEHLAHHDLPDYLRRCRRRGASLIPAVGFQMISSEFPGRGETLCESRTLAAPFGQMNKLGIFDPDALEETGFAPGRHRAEPSGEVILPVRDEVLNLHYKYLGLERLAGRHRALEANLGPEDRRRRFGHRYAFSLAELEADWASFAAAAVDVRGLAPEVAALSRTPRWWRDHMPPFEVREV